MSFSMITAAEAKEISTPALPKRIENFLVETNKAICEAANGGLKNMNLRIPADIYEDVWKTLLENGYELLPLEEKLGMNFIRVSWN